MAHNQCVCANVTVPCLNSAYGCPMIIKGCYLMYVIYRFRTSQRLIILLKFIVKFFLVEMTMNSINLVVITKYNRRSTLLLLL
jgi:hypothetical protein